ncbi:hypothetical protein ALO82_200203 [Pseudomonas syringae pv. broussonetiae]|uniref:Uncharacterized protein n=1 Tax=Pseudomonas savastanoi TaxID=29438 RepID=A0A3M5BW62_PSESS|nr:hypothetical protein [Pseudomonas savastanoi]KPW62924.1 hypothetical protein ALO82_200203 [Pseudomonas syringae pv. broussonetiae]RMS29780.1 hypothetical protein ALP70_02803 [Pseudomonas savastanoi]RMT21954.1 hypothetical protein ALP51_00890 [Pseudomonas savastanoi]
MKTINTPKGNIKILDKSKEKQRDIDSKQIQEFEELQKKAKGWLENLLK